MKKPSIAKQFTADQIYDACITAAMLAGRESADAGIDENITCALAARLLAAVLGELGIIEGEGRHVADLIEMAKDANAIDAAALEYIGSNMPTQGNC